MARVREAFVRDLLEYKYLSPPRDGKVRLGRYVQKPKYATSLWVAWHAGTLEVSIDWSNRNHTTSQRCSLVHLRGEIAIIILILHHRFLQANGRKRCFYVDRDFEAFAIDLLSSLRSAC